MDWVKIQEAVAASYRSALATSCPVEQVLKQVERDCVEDVLRGCGYQGGKAAKRLGLSRTLLFERMNAWDSATRARGAIGSRATVGGGGNRTRRAREG